MSAPDRPSTPPKERYWPDLSAYGLALWIERLLGEEPRQYQFRMVPIHPLTEAQQYAVAEMLLDLRREGILALDEEGKIGSASYTLSWVGERMPTSQSFLTLFPGAVIRPLDTVSLGPWWRDNPGPEGWRSQWAWRVIDPPIPRLEVVPGRYGEVPYELWAESPEQAARYGGGPSEPVSAGERHLAIPLGTETRNGAQWILPAAARDALSPQDRAFRPPPLPATDQVEREDYGEKIGGARKDVRPDPLQGRVAPWMAHKDLTSDLLRAEVKGIRRNDAWPPPTPEELQAFRAAGRSPMLWIAREAIRLSLAASPVSLRRIREKRRHTPTSVVFLAAGFYYPHMVTAVRQRVEDCHSLKELAAALAEYRPRAEWGKTEAAVLIGDMNPDGASWETDDLSRWQDREGEIVPILKGLPLETLLDALNPKSHAPRKPLSQRLWDTALQEGIRPDSRGSLREWLAETLPVQDEALKTGLGNVVSIADLINPSNSGYNSGYCTDMAFTGRVFQFFEGVVDQDALWNRLVPTERSPQEAPQTSENTDPMEGEGIPKRKLPSPRFQNLERIGPARRSGPTTEALLAETFGLRAIEYGLWVKDADRQAMLDLAYDSLADMAQALRLPARAMGFGGQLALALGARGRGGTAAAHYEPARRVINLTKTMGAGTLAHEWCHALDHWIRYRQDPSSVILESQSDRYTVDTSLTSMANGLRDFIQTLSAPVKTASQGHPYRQKAVAQLFESELLTQAARIAHPPSRDLVCHWVRNDVIPAVATATTNYEFLSRFCTSRRGVSWTYQPAHIRDLCRDWLTDHPDLGVWTSETAHEIERFFTNDSLQNACFPYRAFKKVWREMRKISEQSTQHSDFYRSALTLDSGRSQKYWSTPHEIWARGFSAVIHDRMAADGVRNDFASRFSAPGEFTGEEFRASPNPEGEERAAFLKRAQRFCAALQAHWRADPTAGTADAPEEEGAQPLSSAAAYGVR